MNIKSKIISLKSKVIEYKKEILTGIGLVIIISLSFGLGYLSNQNFNHTPIVIEKCSS